MFSAICVFTVAIAVLISILIYLWRSNRSELRRISALSAIGFGFVPPIIGFWRMAHLGTLRLRSALDYGFERKASSFSDFAVLVSLVWLTRSRRWYSFVVFIVALLVSIYWVMVLSTL